MSVGKKLVYEMIILLDTGKCVAGRKIDRWFIKNIILNCQTKLFTK